MNAQKSIGKLGIMLALSLGLMAGPLRAHVEDTDHSKQPLVWDITKLKRLGWNIKNLNTVEADSAGRPTLETDVKGRNKIMRRSTYHANGQLASQSTMVHDRDGNDLYVEKRTWHQDGHLDYLFGQDMDYKNGKLHKGKSQEKKFSNDRLIEEEKKKYNDETNSWETTYRQTNTYYEPRGYMKESLTEEPLKNKKQMETWTEHEVKKGKRGHVVKKWDAKKNDWEDKKYWK